jgi:hypothetical protein
MTLWVPWMNAVRSLRPACQRSRTFLWMLLTLIGLCCRLDLAGVTSYVRVLGLRPEAYHRFLHLFHSKGLDLDKLTACWMKLCLTLFKPVCAGSRLICLADGIKVPKEGKLMPAVKSLHQQSASNSKPDYIMGHSFQAISLLVQGASGHVAAVPLMSRIHEGLVFSNRDSRTLLDKLAVLMFSIANFLGRKILLVADAYYASGKLIAQLLSKGHQLVTRAKSNAVAYLPVPTPQHRRRGRPRIYGKKVPLKELAQDHAAFTSAPSPVYGENNVTLRYRCLDLMWRPAARIVRFVIVCHPHPTPATKTCRWGPGIAVPSSCFPPTSPLPHSRSSCSMLTDSKSSSGSVRGFTSSARMHTRVENHSALMLRRLRFAVHRSYSRDCEVGGSFLPCAFAVIVR